MKSLTSSSAVVVGALLCRSSEATAIHQEVQHLDESTLALNDALPETSSIAPAISMRGDIRAEGVSVVRFPNVFAALVVIFLLMQCLSSMFASISSRKGGRRLAVGGEDPCGAGDGFEEGDGRRKNKKYKDMNEEEKELLHDRLKARRQHLVASGLLKTNKGTWVMSSPEDTKEFCTRVEVDSEGLMTGFVTTCIFDYKADLITLIRRRVKHVVLHQTFRLGGVELGEPGVEETEQKAREFVSRLEYLDIVASSMCLKTEDDEEGSTWLTEKEVLKRQPQASGGEEHSSPSDEDEDVPKKQSLGVSSLGPSGSQPNSPLPKSDLRHRRPTFFEFPSVDSSGLTEELGQEPGAAAPRSPPPPSPKIERLSSSGDWQTSVQETVSHPLTGQSVKMKEEANRGGCYRAKWNMSSNGVEKIFVHAIYKNHVEYIARVVNPELGSEVVFKFIRHLDGTEDVRVSASSASTLTSTEIILHETTATIQVHREGKAVIKALIGKNDKVKGSGCHSREKREQLYWTVHDTRLQAQAVKSEFEFLMALLSNHKGSITSPWIKPHTSLPQVSEGLKWETTASLTVPYPDSKETLETLIEKNLLTGMQRTVWKHPDGSSMTHIPFSLTECSSTTVELINPNNGDLVTSELSRWLHDSRIVEKEIKGTKWESAALDILSCGRKRLILEEGRLDSGNMLTEKRVEVLITKRGKYFPSDQSFPVSEAKATVARLLTDIDFIVERQGLLEVLTRSALDPRSPQEASSSAKDSPSFSQQLPSPQDGDSVSSPSSPHSEPAASEDGASPVPQQPRRSTFFGRVRGSWLVKFKGSSRSHHSHHKKDERR